MTINILKEEVSEYVKKNSLQKALNLMNRHQNLLKDTIDQPDTIITMLTNQLNSLNRDNRCNLIDYNTYIIRSNKIANAILNVCEINASEILKNRKNSLSNFGQGGVSFRQIKQALQGIKDRKNKIDYHQAVDVLADLF